MYKIPHDNTWIDLKEVSAVFTDKDNAGFTYLHIYFRGGQKITVDLGSEESVKEAEKITKLIDKL